MKNIKKKALYISYFGIQEPLVQTQVIPYLCEIKKLGFDMTLLTFEPNSSCRHSQSMRRTAIEKVVQNGLGYTWLTYHKFPSLPATIYDIIIGSFFVYLILIRKNITVIHARNHIPCLIGYIVKKITGCKLIFDIRGFMAEEYVDAGTWRSKGCLFLLTKWIEALLIQKADSFVVLTKRASDLLFPGCKSFDSRGRAIEVIPCCVDFTRMGSKSNTALRRLQESLDLSRRRVIVYSGSLGGCYLVDELAQFLFHALAKDSKFYLLILTQSPTSILEQKILSLGISRDDYSIHFVEPPFIACYLRLGEFAISLIRPCYSKISSSPTKIAEYLACGLPIISTPGIGDLDSLLHENRIGALLSSFDERSCASAIQKIAQLKENETCGENCVETARREFDLSTVGAKRYRRLYRKVYVILKL